MIYGFLDKNIKASNMRDFLSKTPAKFIPLNEANGVPEDASAIAVHGVLRGNGSLIREAQEREIHWIYMDNAGHYFPEMYKRISINATAPRTFRTGKRFEHNTKYYDWRGGLGRNIVVLPPSPPYMDTFGTRDFLNYLTHTLNIYTDKNIIVRGKPAKGKKARPWEEQLAEAYCVVTWGSALALDAVNRGVPTISLGHCPAKLCSFNLEDLETDKLREEPPRAETMDNLTWCSFKREELPQAFETVVENSNFPCFDHYNSYTDRLEIK